MNEIKVKINEQLQQLQMLMHRAMIGHFGKMHNPHRGQGRILAIIKLKPVISQKELTYLLNMSKQAVAELITKLERNGYITREPSVDDKRVVMIRLTKKGAEVSEDAEDDQFDNLKSLDCLNADELVTFNNFLERIIKQYEKQFPDENFEQRRKYMEKFMSSYGHDHGHRQNVHGFGSGRGYDHGFDGHNEQSKVKRHSQFMKKGVDNDE